MKNFHRPVKCEKFKYITILWVPQVESVAKMCKEHYDTKEYEDTLILIDTCFDNNGLLLNPYYFPQKRKIYYNLEHKYSFGIEPEVDDVLMNWLKEFGVNEIWDIEPGIPFFENYFDTKYMPVRYTNFNKDKYVGCYKFDLGFVGVIGGNTQKRNEFFNKYTFDVNIDFSLKIINGLSINECYDDLSNCRFMLDLSREYPQEYQNQLRLMEHICLGHTVLSEKRLNNIFPGLIYEWEDINELNDLVKSINPEDFSGKYKEMTYRDDDYEEYKNKMIKTY